MRARKRKNPTDVKRKFPRDEDWYTIRDAMARTLFATAWADKEETEGRTYPGQDIMDVMPDEVPTQAVLAATQAAEELEKDNKAGLVSLFHLAQEADSADSDNYDDMEEFGSDLAMMVMGTGVSWFDDHNEFPLKVPFLDFSEFDLDEDD